MQRDVASAERDIDVRPEPDGDAPSTVPAGPDPATRPRRWSSGWRAEAVGASATLGLTVLAQTFFLRLWELHPRVPVQVGGDSYLTMIGVKNTVERGWWTGNSQMGAPFGQDLADWPSPGDILHYFAIKVMALFTDDVGLIVNAFWMVTFPTIALACYIACRGLRVTRVNAVAISLLYAFLPFHFLRGIAHMFLSSYFVVPLVCMLVIRQLGDEPLLRVAPGAGSLPRRLLHRGNVAGVVIALLIATTGLYYAVFAAMLLAFAGVVRAARDRRLGELALPAALCALIGFTIVLQMLPTLLHQRANGVNDEAIERSFAGIESFSMKISYLVLPTPGHRIGWFASLRETAGNSPISGEGTEALGLIGATGFLTLLVFAVMAIAGRTVLARSATTYRALAACTLAIIFVAEVGGFSSVIGAFGIEEIRAWNRISVFVAFFSLVAAALLVEAVLARKPRRAFVPVVVAAALVVVGLLDQVSPKFEPRYDDIAAVWNDDQRFVDNIADTVGPDASVFQLPLARFPEQGPLFDMADYEHAVGYLHSDTLHWSYGGMKGREARWQQKLAGLSIDDMLRDVAIAGFDGLYVDRRGYIDRGFQVENDLQKRLGPPARISDDRDQTFFDLRAYRAAVEQELGDDLEAQRAALFEPPIEFDDGFFPVEFSKPSEPHVWAESDASFVIDNEADTSRPLLLTFGYASAMPGPWELTVVAPGYERTFDLGTTRREARIELDLPPGESTIEFHTDAPTDTLPDSRDLRFRLDELELAWR